VRHGEQQDAEQGLPDGPLSEKGKLQARAVAERLKAVPFTGMWHSPLQRAEETARIIEKSIGGAKSEPSALLFDCYPSGPGPELPHAFESFFGGVTKDQIDAGRAQMTDAVAEFLAPARGDRHDLLVTHNFVIAWFVREVLDAPEWRWLGINQANCGITIVRVRSAKPPVLVTHNDLGHLPPELRTGLPEVQPY
jgi:probable phosphoglycerate mutase